MTSKLIGTAKCVYAPASFAPLVTIERISSINKEYRELDPAVIGQLVKSKFLIDGRNALDRDKWRSAGWRVHALGRSD